MLLAYSFADRNSRFGRWLIFFSLGTIALYARKLFSGREERAASLIGKVAAEVFFCLSAQGTLEALLGNYLAGRGLSRKGRFGRHSLLFCAEHVNAVARKLFSGEGRRSIASLAAYSEFEGVVLLYKMIVCLQYTFVV